MFSSKEFYYTKVEIILEIISILSLLLFIIYTIMIWSTVPPKIPTHFNWSGMPDSWGTKGAVPLMLWVTLFIFFVMTFISRFPRAVNFPIPVNEEKSKSHLQLRFSLILWTKAELILFTSYIGVQGIRVALGQEAGLGSWLIPIILLVLFSTIAVFIYRVNKI